jgi:sialic acid synthase SpsE
VKFQTFQTKYFVSRRDRARYERLSSFELPFRAFEELERLAHSLGLAFLSTPLDLESAKFLEPLVDAYKIASGDNDFYPLLEVASRTGKPIIMSSGLSDLQQVQKSKRFIEEQWRAHGIHQALAVLHCVSSYPVAPEEANLAAIAVMIQELGCPVGYSDHTLGIEACLLAVALGARVIEKHFTLDRNFSTFRDHQLSSDPEELKRLVEGAARVRTLLGVPQKTVQQSEASAVLSIRRSIVAANELPQGHRLSLHDLTWIRPAVGLRPGQEGSLIGRVLKRTVGFGEPILPVDVE